MLVSIANHAFIITCWQGVVLRWIVSEHFVELGLKKDTIQNFTNFIRNYENVVSTVSPAARNRKLLLSLVPVWWALVPFPWWVDAVSPNVIAAVSTVVVVVAAVTAPDAALVVGAWQLCLAVAAIVVIVVVVVVVLGPDSNDGSNNQSITISH